MLLLTVKKKFPRQQFVYRVSQIGQHGRIDLELMFLRTAYDMTHEAAFRERMETVAAELQEQQNTSGT